MTGIRVARALSYLLELFYPMARKKLQNYFGSQNDSEIKGHLPNGFGCEISWPHLATQIATQIWLSLRQAP